MRLLLLSVLFLLFVSNPIVRATDVDYDLGIKNIAEVGEENIAKPFSIEVKDRVWVYRGIEEGTKQIKAQGVPSSATQRIRLEPSPDAMHVSYFVDFSEPAERAPDWIDDGLWPMTKEVLHYTNEPRPSPRESETVVFLGPPDKGVFSR